MSENQVPKTRLCRCGKKASVIKDYWISESNVKRSSLEKVGAVEKNEYVCGILRRRFCPACLSKLASHQIKVNRRLNIIILISIFVPLIMSVGKFAFDFFAVNDKSALLPFIVSAVFTLATEALLSYKLGSAQRKRERIKSGDTSDIPSVEELLDSLNFGLDDPKKLKDIPSTDILSDSEGRVNYGMERSGFNMRTMAGGTINIEPMSRRISYAFDNEAEYVKRTYVNAGLLEDNIGYTEQIQSEKQNALSEITESEI